VTGVVGIVAASPAAIWESLHLSRRRYGRRALEALPCDGGSGEAASAPEP